MAKGEFEPFSDEVEWRVIPSGEWQRTVGVLLLIVGIFPAVAATPLNGAGAVASLCFAFGGSLLFWGFMLRYFAALEEKLGLLIVGLGVVGTRDEDESATILRRPGRELSADVSSRVVVNSRVRRQRR